MESIGESAFQNCSKLIEADLSSCTGLTSIGEFVFDGCSSLKSVTFNSGLTSIGQSAFSGCGNLQSVIFNSGLTSIGESAFQSCSNLQKVDLSMCSGLASIGQYAFSGCSNLQKVDLSMCSGLGNIGESAFFDCSNLQSVIFKNASAPTLTDTDVFPDNSALAIYVPYGATGYTSGNLWPDGKVVYDPALSGLEVRAEGVAAALDPPFQPVIGEYTVTVGAAIDKITVTPTATENTEVGQITVNDIPIQGDETSGAISLGGYGSTTVIKIIVINTTSGHSNTYTLNVIRKNCEKITEMSIQGVTPPVRGAVPVTEITECDQYTCTVAWEPQIAAGGTFAADTSYTAVITLQPKPGYTLEGVQENSFKVPGALENQVTSGANNVVIRAVFPKTRPVPPHLRKCLSHPEEGGDGYLQPKPTVPGYQGGALQRQLLSAADPVKASGSPGGDRT